MAFCRRFCACRTSTRCVTGEQRDRNQSDAGGPRRCNSGYCLGTWRGDACGRAIARGILQRQDHHHRAGPSARRLLRSLRSARRRSSEAIHSGQPEHHRAASAGRWRRGGSALVPRAGAARRHHDRSVRRDHRPHAAPDSGAGPVEGRGDDLYRHVHAEQRRLRHPQECTHHLRRRHAQDAGHGRLHRRQLAELSVSRVAEGSRRLQVHHRLRLSRLGRGHARNPSRRGRHVLGLLACLARHPAGRSQGRQPRSCYPGRAQAHRGAYKTCR